MSSDMKLTPHPSFGGVEGPVLCVVMDGVGIGRGDEGDAVHLAYTPVLDRLTAGLGVSTALRAHGKAVGLPSDGDMGNSEVGHNALGAGRVFEQGASLRRAALISSGALFESADLAVADCDGVKRKRRAPALHRVCSADGNVHSHVEAPASAMLQRVASQAGLPEAARVHVLLDGRDVATHLARSTYVERLEAVLDEINQNSGERDYRHGQRRRADDSPPWTAMKPIGPSCERGWNDARAHGLGRTLRQC